MNAEDAFKVLDLMACLYLGRQSGKCCLFDIVQTNYSLPFFSSFYTDGFAAYFTEFLENPERSKAHVFDQRRYSRASEECLQLSFSNHQTFSKGVVDAHQDKSSRRSKPSIWIRRLGVHSRIRKGRRRLKFRQRKSLKTRIKLNQYDTFPDGFPEHEYWQSLSYRWSLDLLPFLLERSAISLELTEILRQSTFTTMAQRFPRRARLAKEAITKYLLRVESGLGEL